MLKTASGIASCLGLAVVAAAIADPETVKAAGAFGPMVTGAAGFTAGVAINFGHELCKRFRERASAYAEKISGLDKNEHVARAFDEHRLPRRAKYCCGGVEPLRPTMITPAH